MATWNSRGLRGSTLEELINRSNEQYREKGLALIQKVPTPITPVRIAKDTRQITLAYFEQKSTVDYIGAVQGIPVCFDAKECKETVFPLANIHEHQVRFMREFEQQEGISFLLIYFSGRNEFYYLTFRDLWWVLGTGAERWKKKFSLRRTESFLFSYEPRWDSGAVSGRNPERFAGQGLTSVLSSHIMY